MKSLFLTIFTFFSLGVFANNESGSISEETILKVSNGVFANNKRGSISEETILKVSKSLKENAISAMVEYCYMGFGDITCPDGSTHSVYSSVYNDAMDVLDALANNFYNRCNGGAYSVIEYEVNQVPCL